MREWSEDDSTHFLDVGRYYVPQRERQVAIVAALVPRLPHAGEVIDLCGGEGLLAEAILGAQADVEVLDLDGSPAMREAAERRLARFGARFRTAACDLRRLALPPGPPRRAIVSSLALHHVEHAAKPALYRTLHDALAPGGALVVADLVERGRRGAGGRRGRRRRRLCLAAFRGGALELVPLPGRGRPPGADRRRARVAA
jgi:tRNA (cmo5U34)-methyltransferase